MKLRSYTNGAYQRNRIVYSGNGCVACVRVCVVAVKLSWVLFFYDVLQKKISYNVKYCKY